MSIIKTLLASFFEMSVCIAQINVTISGKVTDSTGVTPIADAIVQLEKGGLPTISDADGSFTIVGIVGVITNHFNKTLSGNVTTTFRNGYMNLNLTDKSVVEIVIYTIQGKELSSMHMTLEKGSHSVTLPPTAAGVCFYRIKAGNEEFVLKSNFFNAVKSGLSVFI